MGFRLGKELGIEVGKGMGRNVGASETVGCIVGTKSNFPSEVKQKRSLVFKVP